MDELIKEGIEKEVQVILRTGQAFSGTITPREIAGGAIREMIVIVADGQGRNARPAVVAFAVADVLCLVTPQEKSAITMPPGAGSIFLAK